MKTRKELTDATGLYRVGEKVLGMIERGERPLEPHEAEAFARALNIDTRTFYDDPDGTQLDRLEQAVAVIAAREERAQEDRDAILALLAKQDQILIDIGGLLAQQTQILSEMQRVASGLPTDEALRLVTEGARQLEDALAAQAERGAASASQDERRRLAGEG
jgi:hypothetical protein